MRTMILTGLRQMQLVETPVPDVGPDEVLLKLEAIGVCGSDLHYYKTGRIGSQVVEYPFPVGHECAASVAAVGEAVSRLKPGDRVAVEPAVSCGECDQCRADRPHTCRNLRFLGCPGQMDGCMSDFYAMPAACCYPIPDDLDWEMASLVEPLSIGCYAVQQSVPMAGARIAILGAGPIGLSVLAAARDAGAAAIYVTEPIGYRRTMAESLGAAAAIDPYAEPGLSPVLEREPLCLDAVFECAGEQDALDDAVSLLKPGGKLMVIGIPEVERISFQVDQVRRQELCIQNVRRQNHCVDPAIELAVREDLGLRKMITHRFSLECSREAFELLDGYADGVVKAVLFP
jgi:L-iditol 2-dehydrogenase